MSAKKLLRNGKSVLKPIAPSSATKIEARPSPRLTKLLAAVYDRFQKLDDSAANIKARQEFVFHMTDWFDAFKPFTELYDHPEKATKLAAAGAVYRFLMHALPHLMEAGRLLEGQEIRNPFNPRERRGRGEKAD